MPSSTFFRLSYVTVATVHLAFNFFGSHPLDVISKCFLAPTLLARSLSAPRKSPLLAIALTCCFFGDLFLEVSTAPGDLWFLGGMVSFALAHVCFVTILRPTATRSAAISAALPIGLFAYVLVRRTWDGLETDLRIPVCFYAFLLGATAVTSLASHNPMASLGAIIFLISDALILLDVAKDSLMPSPPWFWVMLTYSLAIFCLSEGIMNSHPGPLPKAHRH